MTVSGLRVPGLGLLISRLGLGVTGLGLLISRLGLGVTRLGLLISRLGLGVTRLGLGISGLGLLISGLGLGVTGLGLRAAEGWLLGVSLLRTAVGVGPLVVAHSYLLVQHGKRALRQGGLARGAGRPGVYKDRTVLDQRPPGEGTVSGTGVGHGQPFHGPIGQVMPGPCRWVRFHTSGKICCPSSIRVGRFLGRCSQRLVLGAVGQGNGNRQRP